MVTPNKKDKNNIPDEFPEELTETTSVDAILPDADAKAFDDASTQDVARDVNQPNAPSMSEGMNLAADLSDIQKAMQALFPVDRKPSNIQVSRIQPDMFLTLLNMFTLEEIMSKEPNEKINVIDTLKYNFIDLSIAVDGEGRIDYAELAGAARAEKNRREMASRIGGI
jgi:hypothetical protein